MNQVQKSKDFPEKQIMVVCFYKHKELGKVMKDKIKEHKKKLKRLEREIWEEWEINDRKRSCEKCGKSLYIVDDVGNYKTSFIVFENKDEDEKKYFSYFLFRKSKWFRIY